MLPDHHQGFQDLEDRLRTILPEPYQESCDNVLPLLMGSAGLKYGPDGKVAWDEIWGSFCHLAMAGGPPHKGKLLEPAHREDILAMELLGLSKKSRSLKRYLTSFLWLWGFIILRVA